MSQSPAFHRYNGLRHALISKKFGPDGLTDAEARRLEWLQEKVSRMTEVDSGVMQRVVSRMEHKLKQTQKVGEMIDRLLASVEAERPLTLAEENTEHMALVARRK